MTGRRSFEGRDTRTCGRDGCSHLRTEHKHHGFRFGARGWAWCHCCDCPEFVPEDPA